jgi:processive 1,2-diacylglycerol beta-glucosyltransferase
MLAGQAPSSLLRSGSHIREIGNPLNTTPQRLENVAHECDVAIVSGSAGAGHDSAAMELQRRLNEAGVRATYIDYLDCGPRTLKEATKATYYFTATYAPWVLQYGFELILPLRGKPPWLTRQLSRLSAQRLIERTAGAPVIVSTYPFASQALGWLKASGRITATLATYVTDPAPHSLWLHRAVDYHLVPTETTRSQIPWSDYDVRVVGPLASSEFRTTAAMDARLDIRTQLGVPDDKILAIVMTGSNALGAVDKIAKAVIGVGATPLVLCGRNTRLQRALSAEGILALGWRDDVPQLMRAADVLIHNGGGMSYTESTVVGLPTITLMPIAGHGRLNAAVLESAGDAPWARTAEDLRRLLANLPPRRPASNPDSESAAQFIACLVSGTR